MKSFVTIASLFLILLLIACQKKEFDPSIKGTWMPYRDAFQVFDKIQIEPRDGYYLIVLKSSRISNSEGYLLLYYIGNFKGNHLVIEPSQNPGESNLGGRVLTNTIDIYIDKELGYLYLLNTMYIPTNDRIFEIIQNKIKINPAIEIR